MRPVFILMTLWFLSFEARAQSSSGALLQIDVENLVQYIQDTFDATRIATNPEITPVSVPRNFGMFVSLGDIVAINGQPARGTMTRVSRQFNISRTPNPGQSIGDAARGAVGQDAFEIQDAAGNPIGTIFAAALAPGTPAPGAPLAVTQGNFAITGGTGAFLGARGQYGQAVGPQTIPIRNASITEDPANRRQNGGGRVRWILHVIPMEPPAINQTANGPAIVHSSDFSLVSAAKPAAAGEILSILMTGLGPTAPGVDPGATFPPSPLAMVTSPVQVLVNGKSADVLGAAGYPGSVGGYQVNFRMPGDSPRGSATIQVTAAWMPSRETVIAAQ